MGEAALAVAGANRLRERRDGRDAADRCGRVLLPRDEHASPGRAPGHRGGHRARPRRATSCASRPARPSAELGLARAAPDPRPRHRGARSTPRTRTPASSRPAVACCESTGRRACGSTPASAKGDEVSDRFDPMLAKLIAHGANARRGARSAARGPGAHGDPRRADERRGSCAGCSTSLPCAMARCGPTPSPRSSCPGRRRRATTHWATAAARSRRHSNDPWADGWRLNASPSAASRVCGDEESGDTAESWTATARSRSTRGTAHVDVDGQSLEFRIAPSPTVEEAVRHAAGGEAGPSTLVAPMPGRVDRRARQARAHRSRRTRSVVVIEAMKMEHAVVAPADGVLITPCGVRGPAGAARRHPRRSRRLHDPAA